MYPTPYFALYLNKTATRSSYVSFIFTPLEATTVVFPTYVEQLKLPSKDELEVIDRLELSLFHAPVLLSVLQTWMVPLIHQSPLPFLDRVQPWSTLIMTIRSHSHPRPPQTLSPCLLPIFKTQKQGDTMPRIYCDQGVPDRIIDFTKDADGTVTREGPRQEKDELTAHNAWARKCQPECQRFRKEADDKYKLYFDWARRFEAKSESCIQNYMPGHIESMFDECDYSFDIPTVLRRVSKAEACWLACFTRDRVKKERETLELELGLRSFRVLLIRDSRVTRRSARRVVELPCWDVLSLLFDGATAEHFKVGQRFQKSARMDRHAKDSHVYVSSSKIRGGPNS
ncbi:hypothetical protein H4582DRAFT_2125221 [Lactarius indigo]|nr:hypothetical protein H4582DRAFT_2125221 [Lactarius indigo]